MASQEYQSLETGQWLTCLWIMLMLDTTSYADASVASTSQPLQDEDEGEDPPHPPYRQRGNEVRAYTNYSPSTDDLSEESSALVDSPRKSESTKNKLEESLRKNFLFGELEEDQLMAVIDAMKQVKVSKGDTIIQQGEDGDYFYVIFCGTYEATVNQSGKETTMQIYSEEGSFGELALLYNRPRRATVRALTDGVLYSLGRNLFKRIILKSAYNKRKLFTQLIDSVSIFDSLTEFEKLKISDVLSTMGFEDGQKIITQGDQAHGMYFVISGSVKITKTVDGQEVLVKEINSGGYFGELALLRKQPRAANALAVGRTKVAFLDEEAFERLILTHQLKETMLSIADEYL